MSGVYFYTLILSFASGIFLRSFFVIEWEVALWLLLVAVLVGVWVYRVRKTTYTSRMYVVVAVLCGGALGILRYDGAVALVPAPMLATNIGSPHTYTGLIVREPEVGERSTNVTVQIGDELVLVKTDRYATVQYGDTISFAGTLALPEPFVTDLGRQFDYPAYLRAKGISYTMSFATIAVTDDTTGDPFLRFLFVQKARFISALQNALPEPEAGLGAGLLLGVNHVLGDELETIFRRAGIIHIVVLSGYNIVLVVQFVMLLLGRALPLRARAVVGVIAIICFALVVGLGASVVRASVMAALSLCALMTDRHYAVTRALFVAGAGMLLVNPYLLTADIGFQLSFMATLGLLLVSERLVWMVSWAPERFGLREFLTATLATQIAVLPLLLYYMGELSVVAPLVNMLVLPVVATAMLCTFVTGVVAFVLPPLALPFAYATYVVLAYIIGIATTFSALPVAVVSVAWFPWQCVFLLYVVIGVWVFRPRRQSSSYERGAVDGMDGWTIVEEPDEKGVQKTGQANTAHPVSVAQSRPEGETPIFFR